MHTTDTPLATHADALVNLAEALCSLPAIPTRNWVDLAASCLCEIDRAAIGVVMLASTKLDGSADHIDAVGIGLRRASPQLDESAATLRSTLTALSSVGSAPPGGAQLIRPSTPEHAELQDAAAPLEHCLAGAAVARLTPSQPDRVVLAALLAKTPWTSEALPVVLRAATPLLARRAHLAIGAGIRGECEWLTERERLVLNQLTLGKSVRQIADDLDRSPHTIHDHVKSLHRKLDASSRGELIARALGHITAAGDQHPPITEPKLATSPATTPPFIEQKPTARHISRIAS